MASSPCNTGSKLHSLMMLSSSLLKKETLLVSNCYLFIHYLYLSYLANQFSLEMQPNDSYSLITAYYRCYIVVMLQYAKLLGHS